jgi:hypothetical protein
MCTIQRATSYYLYKHRSWTIDVFITIESIQLLFILVFTLTFYLPFFSSIRSSIHHFNLLGCHGSCLSTIQMSLGQRRSTSSKPNGAPDCRRSQQNQTIRFAKPIIHFLQFQVGASDLCSFHVVRTPEPLWLARDVGRRPATCADRRQQCSVGPVAHSLDTTIV